MLVKETIQYIVWQDLEKEIKIKTGKDVRNWNNRSLDNLNIERQDFWLHLGNVHQIFNGCILSMSPLDEIAYLENVPEHNWLIEIYKVIQEIFDENGFGDEVDIMYAW